MIKNLKQFLKRRKWLYAFVREFKKLREERKIWWKDAVKQFEKKEHQNGTLKDYKKAMLRQRFSYNEYVGYQLWNLRKDEIRAYISEKEMRCIYRKTVEIETFKWFENKLMSHAKFAQFMQRDWLCPSLCSFDSFRQFASSRDCIIKPWLGSLGRGVFMVKKDENNNLEELYERCRKEGLIIEERVQSCQQIAEFHPQSLNTIRVMTMSNGKRCELVAAELRVGRGDSVVDNASVGGILCPIDANNGIIVGDGIDKSGRVFVQHPDSGKTIKGFRIPYWEQVVETCKELTMIVPEVKIAGWDLCVCENGQIEMIEVNTYPNVMGLQMAFGVGLKPRIQALGKDLLGYDLMQLIHIYANPHINCYERKQFLNYMASNEILQKEYVDWLEKVQRE